MIFEEISIKITTFVTYSSVYIEYFRFRTKKKCYGTSELGKVNRTEDLNNDKESTDFRCSRRSFHKDATDGKNNFANNSVRQAIRSIWLELCKAWLVLAFIPCGNISLR